MFRTIVPCAIGKGLVDIDNRHALVRKESMLRSLGWLVVKATWQQPFNNIVVRTLCGLPITAQPAVLFKGSVAAIAREALEFGMVNFFSRYVVKVAV